MPESISVVLAIADALVATSLGATLARNWHVLPLVETVPELEAALQRWRPTVALMTTELGGVSLLGRLAQLTVAYSPTRFVVCDHVLSPALAEYLPLNGVLAVVDYSTPLQQLHDGIAALGSGGRWPKPGLARSAAAMRPLKALSNRERQLLLHLQAGRTHLEAALRMGISPKTEEYYSRSLRRKYGFPSQQAVDYRCCVPE